MMVLTLPAQKVVSEQQPEEENNRGPTPLIQEPITKPEQVEEEDNVPYTYPKYRNEPNAKAHIYMHFYIHGRPTMSHND